MILTIVQARLGSTRLPGKILLPIAGKPILRHVYDAAPEPKVVAMPLAEHDQFISKAIAANKSMGVNIIFPDVDPDDVLGRFYVAWRDRCPEADWILRLTADCPMLTREIVERFLSDEMRSTTTSKPGKGTVTITEHLKPMTIYTNRPYDLDGFDMELFSVEALKMAHEHATEPYDREHVTAWMYRHLNVHRFSVFGRPVGPENSEEKVSVDTMEDYEKVKNRMEGK